MSQPHLQRAAPGAFAALASIALLIAARSAQAQTARDILARPPFGRSPAPPRKATYLQFGLALTAEVVLSPGPLCDAPRPCILGSGGGIAARIGWRSAGPWYFGGAYELSKQDPSNLYRLATLQQVRAEVRYYVFPELDTQPFATLGAGAVAYGNQWARDTGGPTAFMGAGVETQLSRTVVVGVAFTYRLMAFSSFVDSAGTARDGGVSQIVGLDFILEARDPR